MLKKIFAISMLFALTTLTACAGDEQHIEAAERIIAVNTASVTRRDISTELSFAGRVQAEENIAVAPRLPGGMVDTVLVDIGDFIEAGDILFTLDAVDLQLNYDALTAQLATAEAAVAAANTGVALAGGAAMQQQILAATGGIAQARAAVAQAETGLEQATLGLNHAQSAYDLARQSFADTTVLFMEEIVPRATFEQAEMGLLGAQIALEQAQNNHHLATVGVDTARTAYGQAVEAHQIMANEMPTENLRRAQDGLAQAVAARDSLLVTLDAARTRMDDAIVRSPISGVIATRAVEPQTMMIPGMPPFTVVSAGTVLVNVQVTGAIINQINVGDEAAVHIRDANTEPFIGVVTMASPAANEMTAAFAVEVTVQNDDGLIRPGMFAEVFFTREQAENVIVVTRDAVLSSAGETVVYLAENEQAVRRRVETGIDNGFEIEVTSGLYVGEALIVVGQAFVTDGVSIIVLEAA